MAHESELDVRIRKVDLHGPGVLQPPKDGQRILVPELIVAEIQGLPWDVTFTIRMSEDDDPTPELAEVALKQRPGGDSLSPDMMRTIRWAEAKHKAIELVATRWTATPSGQIVPASRPVFGYDVEGIDKRRSQRVEPAEVARAYAIYQRLKASGRRDYLTAAAYEAGLGRATMARYVKRAEAGEREEV